MLKISTLKALSWVVPLILLTASASRAGSGAQVLDRIITVELQEVPVSVALNEIEVAAAVKFVYSPSQLDLSRIVTLSVKEQRLQRVLNDLLGPLAIAYTVEPGKEYILLKPLRSNVSPTLQERLPERAAPLRPVTGTVTDAATQQPIAGVNIVVKGTTSGTTTDADGKYTISAEEDDMLVFSFIGYKKFETQVGGRVVIDVVLEEDVAALREVVVNAGYYTTTDKMRTGNIVKVTSEDIERQPVTSPLLALQGRVAGLEITPASGTPGSAPTIRIRGNNSLRYYTGNYPLYIVDGIPVNSSQLYSNSGTLMYGGYDPISTINPANIESIEVLKDADATAIYGSRGANGVILITTKDATPSTETSVDVSFYRGAGHVSNKLDVLNTEEYLEMRTEAFQNDNLTPDVFQFDVNGAWDEKRYTDWQEVLLGGTATITDLQASVSGGSQRTSFRLGFGHHKETLVFPGDFGYRRASVHLNVDHSSSNEKLNVSLSVNYGADKNQLFNGSVVNMALTLPPNAPSLYDENGELNWAVSEELFQLYGLKVSSWTNPLSLMRRTHDSSIGSLISNGVVSYKLARSLSLKSNFGYSELSADETIRSPISYRDPNLVRASSTASADFTTNSRKSWIIEPQLVFSRQIGQQNFNATVGATWQKNVTDLQSISADGYTSDVLLESIKGAPTINFIIDDFSEYKYSALFARLGYTFKERYLINLTGRRDGSSRFGPGNRYSNFGAIGIGWIFSEEQLVKDNVGFLSFGKLRGSYGITGNDQIGDYQFYSTYSISNGKYQNAITLHPTALHNPDFQWEVTNKMEATAQMGFLRDAIVLELSWYKNTSSNQLVDSQLPATTGFTSILSNLPAMVENKGLELVVKTTNVTTDNFRWSSSLNLSKNKNKLVAFPDIEDSPYRNTYKVGEPLSIQRLYTWAGVNPETGLHEVVDLNEDGFINDDDKVFMNPQDRKYYGGFVNSLVLKGFELSFLIQFASQYQPKYLPGVPGRFGNVPAELILDRWQRPGDIVDVQKLSTTNEARNALIIRASASDFNREDASFIRLKTLSFAYNLPGHILTRLRMQQGRIFVQGQNVLTFTNYSGLDPETRDSLPPLRIFSAGLQLNF